MDNISGKAEIKPNETPKPVNIIRSMLLICGLGAFAFGVCYLIFGFIFFLFSSPKERVSELFIFLVPFFYGLPFLVAFVIVKKRRKSNWIILLILSIFSMITLLADKLAIMLIGIIPGLTLLACLFNKQVRNYYLGDEADKSVFNASSLLMIILMILPVAILVGTLGKDSADSHDESLSSALFNVDYIIKHDIYYRTHKTPETNEEIIRTIDSWGPEKVKKEPFVIFFNNGDLTYQKTGNDTYSLCGNFKTVSSQQFYGPDDSLRFDNHKKGMNCFQGTIGTNLQDNPQSISNPIPNPNQ